MTVLTTTRLDLRYPDLAEAADIAAIVQHLAEDVDGAALGWLAPDTFANRPAAGTAGLLFYATDTGAVYLDDGTAWRIVGSNNRVGLLANIPAANAVAVGTHYFATDQVAEYVSDGTNWIRVSTPAGAVVICPVATADAGYILLQGQDWPSTTGIYAALYARYGTAKVPDMRKRMPIGLGSDDTDFDTVLKVGGEKVHTLTVNEIPAHNHPVTDPGHRHDMHGQNSGELGGTSGVGIVPTTSDTLDTTAIDTATTGITIGNKGGGASHNNVPPFIVVNFQAKL